MTIAMVCPTRGAAALACGLGVAALGCGIEVEPSVPLSRPTALCHHEVAETACRPAEEVEGWLAETELRILHVMDTPAGRHGAKVLTLAAPSATGELVFRAKWRAYDTTNTLNVPRRELAAHAVQKLFLAPHDWVVPPTAGHCFPLDHYRVAVDAGATPTFDGTRCVHGFLSYWLEGALDIDDAEGEGWIADEDLTAGAEGLVANVNLLSHVIDHGDSHPEQFVLTAGSAGPRLHLVDNSVAFSLFRNPTLGPEWDWSKLRVRAVPRASAERLATLDEDDVMSLVVVEQYERSGGLLIHTRSGTPGHRTDMGYRWSGGDLQVGLTRTEASRVHDRIRGVVERLERGVLGLLDERPEG